ncbi:hypothetical protein K438DRAFT_932784 [Mycena galopus ATCC 62051]|nr:hypothetical protein K438DRAFT_932784 [Mycena galopus ATCC 62051]
MGWRGTSAVSSGRAQHQRPSPRGPGPARNQPRKTRYQTRGRRLLGQCPRSTRKSNRMPLGATRTPPRQRCPRGKPVDARARTPIAGCASGVGARTWTRSAGSSDATPWHPARHVPTRVVRSVAIAGSPSRMRWVRRHQARCARASFYYNI